MTTKIDKRDDIKSKAGDAEFTNSIINIRLIRPPTFALTGVLQITKTRRKEFSRNLIVTSDFY